MANNRHWTAKMRGRVARDAQTGPHWAAGEAARTPVPLAAGTRVRLMNDEVTVVKERTAWGDYILVGYPKKYFPPECLKKV